MKVSLKVGLIIDVCDNLWLINYVVEERDCMVSFEGESSPYENLNCKKIKVNNKYDRNLNKD